MLLNKYKETYQQALTDMLWRQWVDLGIAGYAPESKSGHTADPEALLIFTARYARYNQRLYDLVPEWLRQYGSLINIHRLKTLLSKSQWKDTQSLLLLLTYATAPGEKRWQKLISTLHTPGPASPLFIDPDSGTPFFIPKADPSAARLGFQRPPYIPAAKITTTLPENPATYLLRLRAHYGTTARAEIILALLNTPACSVQELTRACSFSWGVISSVLAELTCGGIITPMPGVGTRKIYTLTTPEKIKQLISASRIKFPDWPAIFDTLGKISSTLSNPRLATLSEATLRHEINRCISDTHRTRLLQSNLPLLRNLTPDSLLLLPTTL